MAPLLPCEIKSLKKIPTRTGRVITIAQTIVISSGHVVDMSSRLRAKKRHVSPVRACIRPYGFHYPLSNRISIVYRHGASVGPSFTRRRQYPVPGHSFHRPWTLCKRGPRATGHFFNRFRFFASFVGRVRRHEHQDSSKHNRLSRSKSMDSTRKRESILCRHSPLMRWTRRLLITCSNEHTKYEQFD